MQELEIETEIAAPPSRLWRTLTDPDCFRRRSRLWIVQPPLLRQPRAVALPQTGAGTTSISTVSSDSQPPWYTPAVGATSP